MLLLSLLQQFVTKSLKTKAVTHSLTTVMSKERSFPGLGIAAGPLNPFAANLTSLLICKAGKTAHCGSAVKTKEDHVIRLFYEF